MPSIALVLGGGGVVGGAFHAGAIAALGDSTGWDPREAELIVGTSAGSTIAATLRLGVAPTDLRNRATGRPLSADGRQRAPEVPPHWQSLPSGPPLLRWLRPSAPWLTAAALFGRGAPRPLLALAGLAPRGTIDGGPIGERIRAVAGDGWWPELPTWIPAVRLRDGRRTVFGRDAVEVAELAQAVQASSAIPGYFEPVHIGRHTYIDGGVHSPTNADLAAGLGFDLVVVISTMTATARALRRDPRLTARLFERLHHCAAQLKQLRETLAQRFIAQSFFVDRKLRQMH